MSIFLFRALAHGKLSGGVAHPSLEVLLRQQVAEVVAAAHAVDGAEDGHQLRHQHEREYENEQRVACDILYNLHGSLETQGRR